MPEIKHQFTGGKMNKDLDERLVPNGEYIDAMNIQVSTSEGSDVGTVQNILGNNRVNSIAGTQSNLTFKCVGTFSDEKENYIYWFVTSVEPANLSNPGVSYIVRTDVNYQTKNISSIEYVFCDLYKGINPENVIGPGSDVLGFDANRIITSINIIDGMLFWTDGYVDIESEGLKGTEPKKINIQRSIEGTSPNGHNHTRLINHETNIDINSDIEIELKHITVIKPSPNSALHLDFDTGRDTDKMYSGIVTVTPDPGILPNTSSLGPFWDDVAGGANQPANTGLSAPFVGLDNLPPHDFSSFEVGDTIYLQIETDIDGNDAFELEYSVGMGVVLKEFNGDGDVPITPVIEYRIKGKIVDSPHYLETTIPMFTQDPATLNYGATNIYPSSLLGRCIVAINVTSIDGFPPSAEFQSTASNTLNYVIDRWDDVENLYEFKFPRFSYRYKYEDGEYSTFAPWSEIAFLPGSFDHHPKKGYNLGMTNRLLELTISEFIPIDIPLDVIEVDILYKEDTSTSIYVVETIRPNDNITTNTSQNYWDSNSYLITSETIKSILPTNQLIRPWDNVPRKALAQDITGNRIVYANYLQNYDLHSGNTIFDFSPDFNCIVSQKNNNSPVSVKSIKSLREYQLGVVFVDEYGRETPVISNPSGTVKLSKLYGNTGNQFQIDFGNATPPFNMKYFKFYVKEVSGEYYNMAMDRFYDAEDGNVWLAFPSADFNKLDIDTFLILKKGTEDDELVVEKARYKVLAIENEAPDFIKLNKLHIATEVHTTTGSGINNIFGTDMEFAPEVGGFKFRLKYQPFRNGSGSDLQKVSVLDNTSLYFEFSLGTSQEHSNRYRVANISRDGDTQDSSDYYNITIDGQFGDDVNFLTDDPTGFASTKMLETATIKFYKYTLENKPQFDGRFFVKVYNDGTFQKYIKPLFDVDEADFKITTRKTIYSLDKDLYNPWFAGGTIQHFVPKAPLNDNTTTINVPHHTPPWMDLGYGGFPRINYEEVTDPPWGLNTWTPNSTILDIQGSEAAVHQECWGSGWEDTNGTYHLAEDPFDVKTGGFKRKFQIGPWFENWYFNPEKRNSYGSAATAGIPFGEINRQSPLWEGQDNTDRPKKDIHDTWFIDSCYYSGRCVEGNKLAADDTYYYGAKIKRNHGGDNPDRSVIGNPNSITDDLRSGWPSQGIKLNPDDDESSIIDLGFGPISGTEGDDNFFDIGGEAPGYEGESDFVQKLYPGSYFRWKDDPEQTIYTIQAQIDERQLVRFFTGHRHLDQDNGPTAKQSADYGLSTNDDPRQVPEFMLPSNFTKGWRLRVSPAMSKTNTYWNPYGPLGPIGSTGVKMTIAHTNPTTNPSVQIYEPINTDDIKNFHIYLDTITAADENHPGSTRYLVPGMIITSYSDGSTTQVLPGTHDVYGQYIMIRSIEYDATKLAFRVNLTGYEYPLVLEDMPGNTGGVWSGKNFAGGENIVFEQARFNRLSRSYVRNWSQMNDNGYSKEDDSRFAALGYQLEFVEPINPQEILPESPAVWETEPKEYADLNIYYEVGSTNPTMLDETTLATAIPIGSTIDSSTGNWSGPLKVIGYLATPTVTGLTGMSANLVQLNGNGLGLVTDDFSTSFAGSFEITKPDGTIFGVNINTVWHDSNGVHGIEIDSNLFANIKYTIPWHNCYSFGNGVESNRIRDNFNLPFISNGVKASTTLSEPYKEEHRKYGLIYSGLYNSISGVNNLNQFIQAEKITKDVNPIYGSIQKLHSRDSDLVALCEDKCLKILANKDAVYNADGNPQLVATPNVLGQTIPFAGEYGISTDPESFASEAYRAYFSDKVRGVILRLSKDGLSVVSNYGMKDWFRDNLKLSNNIIGSYDDRNDEYNIKLEIRNPEYTSASSTEPEIINKVLSFREDVKGWVSFKSFTDMELGGSCANNYYTFKHGALYEHYSDSKSNRNTFYGIPTPSSFEVMLNDDPGIIKTYNTLNYEGSQSKVDKFVDYVIDGVVYNDSDYHNLMDKPGWSVSYINTDMQDGAIKEFIGKENKWFNHIKGTNTNINEEGQVSSVLDSAEFSFQGLGYSDSNTTNVTIYGCMDPLYLEYDPNATIDTTPTSCMNLAVPGCMNASALNYNCSTALNPNATTPCSDGVNIDDGSCLIPGCTDNGTSLNGANIVNDANGDGLPAFNYNPTATYDDGSCIPIIYGCTDSTMFGYDPTANTDDGSCAPFINGCTEPTADNQDVTANTDDGSCRWYGCWPGNTGAFNIGTIDILHILYAGTHHNGNTSIILTDPNNACCYDQGCTAVGNSNYVSVCSPCLDVTGVENGQAFTNGTSFDAAVDCCNPCVYGCTEPTAGGYDPLATCDDGSCTGPGCTDLTACNYDVWANSMLAGSCLYPDGCSDSLYVEYDPVMFPGGISPNASGQCDDNGNSCLTLVMEGCTDNGTFLNGLGVVNDADGDGFPAFNYNHQANVDDGSCYPVIMGCMNSNAYNFIPLVNDVQIDVNTDDGSCCTIPGCTDPAAPNYNGQACHDDGSCLPPLITGCKDATPGIWADKGTGGALNNPVTYLGTGMDGWNKYGGNTPLYPDYTASNNKQCSNPQQHFNNYPEFEPGRNNFFEGGCYEATTQGQVAAGFKAANYDPTVDIHDQSYCIIPVGCDTIGKYNYSPHVQGPGVCIDIIEGCKHQEFTDSDGNLFWNYNVGSGILGASLGVVQWSQAPVDSTGNFHFDVNTHNQSACIPINQIPTGVEDEFGVISTQTAPNPDLGPAGCYVTQQITTGASTGWAYSAGDNIAMNYWADRDYLVDSPGNTEEYATAAGSWSPIPIYLNHNNKEAGWGWAGNSPYGYSPPTANPSEIGHQYNLGVGTGGGNPAVNAPYNWAWSWYEWNGNLHDPGNLLVNASSGSEYNTGYTDFAIGIPDLLKWDPINSNACCIRSGCLHPAAYNFDLAGYQKGYGSDPDNHDSNNPIYIGIGAQHEAPIDWDVMETFIDDVTGDEYKVAKSGKACTTCTSQNLITASSAMGAYPPPGGASNNSHFHTYFDGANGPRGLRGGTDGVGGDTPYIENGVEIIGPFYPSDWAATPNAGSAHPNANSNPWDYRNAEWNCCIFPWNDNFSDGNPVFYNDSGEQYMGCTDPEACPMYIDDATGNQDNTRLSKNGYHRKNAWTNDKATSVGTSKKYHQLKNESAFNSTAATSDINGCCYPDTTIWATDLYSQCAHCGGLRGAAGPGV
tara:strand:- start:6219 stop:15794 length:9576 start_codon:yes stop_codon:yes gene_type:complete